MQIVGLHTRPIWQMRVPLVPYHIAGPSDVTHRCGDGSVCAQSPLELSSVPRLVCAAHLFTSCPGLSPSLWEPTYKQSQDAPGGNPSPVGVGTVLLAHTLGVFIY